MRSLFIAVTTVLAVCVTCVSCTREADRSDAAPRLVVVVVVDQLRPDLLTRYDACFQGGLRRLLDEGYRFENATHDHARTNTAPGHATLGTGALPAQHGIVDNSWYERVGERFVGVAAVSDSTVHIPGVPEMSGVSPHKMQASTLAEWMQEHDQKTRVVSVAGKDRSAIFLAGRARGHVYWFARDAGRLTTSSWYAEREPEWVQQFHADVWPTFSSDSVWACNTPAEWRRLAREDDVHYEGAGKAVFPHPFEAPEPTESEAHAATAEEDQRAHSRAFWSWFYRTPRVDASVLEFAITALRAEELGQDETPDYLAVGLSATDVIGHSYGPLSLEQLDNLLQMDRALGRFFDVLDAEVGAGRWVLGLSADHGVGTMPEQLQANGIDARRVPRDEIEALFADLEAATNVYAETGVLSSTAELERVLATRTLATDFVAAAMPRTELAYVPTGSMAVEHAQRTLTAPGGDPFVRLYRNSYYNDRILGGPLWSREQRVSLGTYGVEVRLDENVVVHRTAATHGSPYRYDRHVPVVFMGSGVEPGTSDEAVRSVDFAPTLAKLLGVPVPADRAGSPLMMPANPANP